MREQKSLENRKGANHIQTKEKVRREQNEELIDVLTAISIVSKRLSKKLTVQQQRYVEKPRGGKYYDTRQSAENK
ncbi:MAG TPA: hypothetical protein DDZ99_07440 [Clostridiales bacterium]|nr:hypothetical protein [Clostridiales bacterium]